MSIRTIELLIDEDEHVCFRVDQLPEILGFQFAQMDEEEQARFWAAVSNEVSQWRGSGAFQWNAMAGHMTDDARRTLADMAEAVSGFKPIGAP